MMKNIQKHLKRRDFLTLFLVFAVAMFVWIPHVHAADFLRAIDISYVSDADERQVLDVYAPKGAGKHPVLIYVHGGAWMIGDKRQGGKDKAKFFTERGFVFVSVNYRLSPDHVHPAQIEDVAAAVKWVVQNISNYGGDSNKIAIAGHSAGAHLVALLGTDLQYLDRQGLKLGTLKAVLPIDTASFDFTLPRISKGKKWMDKIIQKTFGKDTASLASSSPRQHVLNHKNRLYPRFKLFVAAERKGAVMQTENFYDALKAAGADVEKYVVPGASHREMNLQISDPESVVGQKIVESLRSF